MFRYRVGTFVAVLQSDTWWIGAIKKVMRATDEYLVRFMHHVDRAKIDKCYIRFPENDEDVNAVSHCDVLMEVSKPIGTICGQTWCQTLPQKEIDKILQKVAQC